MYWIAHCIISQKTPPCEYAKIYHYAMCHIYFKANITQEH